MVPFFSLPLACGMTDGKHGCSCQVHISLFYEQSKKKNFFYLAHTVPNMHTDFLLFTSKLALVQFR
jgi:hypothetical protein